MARFVFDASATLAWCFKDESTPWSDTLLQRLKAGDKAIAPAHWPAEVSIAFLSALRRKRASLADILCFWDDLSHLPISVEPPLTPGLAKAVLDLAANHNLTVYDALYLELAIRLGLPLATLDTALRQVAPAKAVALL